jgi:hypothetical protein
MGLLFVLSLNFEIATFQSSNDRDDTTRSWNGYYLIKLRLGTPSSSWRSFRLGIGLECTEALELLGAKMYTYVCMQFNIDYWKCNNNNNNNIAFCPKQVESESE